MKYFQPHNKQHDSLEAVLLTNEGFVAVDDSWEYALYVDWVEYDPDEKETLFRLSGQSEEEIEKQFIAWALSDESEEDHVATMADAFHTVSNWREMDTI